MYFNVYDQYGMKRPAVHADTHSEAIQKARSPVNRFPMVESELDIERRKIPDVKVINHDD